jgi:cytochrome c peroxidase
VWRLAAILVSVSVAAAGDDSSSRSVLPIPLGINPAELHSAPFEVTKEKIKLGQMLFFEKRLSHGAQLACATCHRPEKAFTDGRRTARGIDGYPLSRNTPTLINRGLSQGQLWDMSAATIEAQIEKVILNPSEMAGSFPAIVKFLKATPKYSVQFAKAFSGEPSKESVIQALSSFVRSLLTGNSPYDRYKAGDKTALSEPALRGMNLFFNKFRCVKCHSGSNFSNEKLSSRCYPEVSGLSAKTVQQNSHFKVKTPTLRNLHLTGPYMHNGRLETLDEVIEFYNQTTLAVLKDMPAQTVLITSQEKSDLVAFLKSLSSQ